MNKLNRIIKFIVLKLAEIIALAILIYISYWYGRLVEIFLMGSSWCNEFSCGTNSLIFYTLSGFGSLLVSALMIIGLFYSIKYIIKKNWEWAGKNE